MYYGSKEMRARLIAENNKDGIKEVTKDWIDCEIDCLNLKKLSCKFYNQVKNIEREIMFYKLVRAGYQNDMFKLVAG